MNDLKEKTVSGLSWSLADQAVIQVFSLIIGIVLARLLGPANYGLVAMVTVLTQFAFVFADMGLGSALIQKKALSNRDICTVFWINLLLGILIAIVIAACSPAIAAFYGKPILKFISLCISINFVFSALNIVQKSLLQKQLEFKKLFFVNLSASVVSGVVAILLAILGWGVWSLVVQLILGTLTSTVALWIQSPWRPQWTFSTKSMKEVLGYGLPLLGTNSINYWMRNIDNLLIGRYWGDVSLGFYDRSYRLMLFPLNNLTRVVSRVMFPSLSKIQHDKRLVTSTFLRVIGSTALITFPISIGTFVLAEPLILSIYGEKWIGCIGIFRVLSLLGINQSISALNGIIFQSQGATWFQFKWGIVFKLFVIVAIVIGLPYGAFGVAVSYTIASTLITVPNWLILGRVIPIKLTEILRECAGPFIASATMGLVVFATFLALQNANCYVQTVVCVLCGIASYVGIVSFFQLRPYVELMSTINSKLASTFTNNG